MSLLMYDELTSELVKKIENGKNRINIISAFCKIEALEYLDKYTSSIPEKKIVVRFRMDDLLSGVTDIDLYDYCKNHGWELYINLDLHAKVYLIDKECFIGSANLTSHGLSIDKLGNLEISKFFELDEEEIIQLNKVFASSRKMDDELYEIMKNKIANTEHVQRKSYVWDKSIINEYNQTYELLFQEDFPLNDSPKNMIIDEKYIGIERSDSIEIIKEKFADSKIVKWLISILEKKENNEIYFGELSEKIHSIIFQEPKQYREDVKKLQERLYNWLTDLNYDFFEIDVPNHSTRIRYKKS